MYQAVLRTSLAIAALVVPVAVHGQERQASIRGGGSGNGGTCTIEVSVDGVAEIEIRGDRGNIRTLAGQPAQWRRFECSERMPSNPANFRFSGVDGRGRQQLVREPQNGGATVVRIEDPSGGSEGYTFRLEWQGGSDSGIGDRRDRDRRFPGDQGSGSCEDAVRERASQQLNSRDIRFRDSDAGDRRGRDSQMSGTFELRRGNGQDLYRYTCEMDGRSQRVRSVNIVPVNDRGYNRDGRNMRGDSMPDQRIMDDCRRAAELRLQRDGYQDVEIGSLNPAETRGRNQSISGSARARRRGQTVDFNFVCPVDARSGNVGVIQLNRR